MKFAVVGGERREPHPKSKGVCPGCGDAVTAKCGAQRVWHWAHKGKLNCDPWWEPETAWHRAWKNLFPAEWQEVPMRSPESGELHIADVRTPHGLVLEFQHSAIDHAERLSREHFYRNMVWIVDGTRLKSDLPRIYEHLPNWRTLPESEVQRHWSPMILFPKRWLGCAVPVLFDFNGTRDDAADAAQDNLICLMPGRFDGQVLFFALSRESLAQIDEHSAQIFDWQALHRRLTQQKQQLLRLSTWGGQFRRSRF